MCFLTRSIVVIAVLMGTNFPANLFASRFVKVSLQLDGSADPPGDVVNVRLLLRHNEAPVELQVRPYRVVVARPVPDEPNRPNQVSQIKAKTNAHRDADGFVVVKTAVPPVDSDQIVDVKIIVPYASLDLPIGKHTVGYECRAIQSDKTAWSCATELSLVTLRNQPRLVAKDRGRTVSERIPRSRKLMTRDPAATDGFRISEMTDFQEVRRPVIEAGPPNIEISQGFVREALTSAEFALTADPDPRAGTADRAWIDKPKQVIYFATNRDVVLPAATDATRFGNNVSADVTYGSCLVNIPMDHERGELERPSWWQSPDPKKHFIVDGLNSLPAPNWLQIIRNELTMKREDTLVFVHGYNNSFESTTLVGAQLKVDLQLGGPVVVFSWPSEGRTTDLLNLAGPYHRDEEKAKQSGNALATVLKNLLEQRGAIDPTAPPGRIHLLAHSMGNRVLLEALAEVAPDFAPNSKPFGHIILAAPDVDQVQFFNRVPQAEELAESVSLYFCREDAALLASQTVHMNKTRVGQGDPLVLRPKLWTIDCDKANTSWLGHGYIVERDELLIDLELLLKESRLPSKRPTIRQKMVMLGIYWQFP